MSYQFLDANSSVLTADSSVVSGVVQQPIIQISSVLSVIPVTFSGSPSISGAVTIIGVSSVSGSVGIIGTPSVSGAITAMGNLNITMASVLANTVVPIAVGGIGEQITANAPLSQWVQGVASVFTGVIQPIIPAQGSSVFSYITSLQATNASANAVYMTFYGATSSIIGYLPVPANGGAIPTFPNGWKTSANGAFSASVSGVASVFLSASGFISKT